MTCIPCNGLNPPLEFIGELWIYNLFHCPRCKRVYSEVKKETNPTKER